MLFQVRPILWENEAFLEKPFTDDGLLEAVSLLLSGHVRQPSSLGSARTIPTLAPPHDGGMMR